MLIEIATNADRNINSLCPSSEAKERAVERLIKLIPVINASAYDAKSVIRELKERFPKIKIAKAEKQTIMEDMAEFLHQFSMAVNYTSAYIDNVTGLQLSKYLDGICSLYIHPRKKKIGKKHVLSLEYELLLFTESEPRTWKEIRAEIFADLYMTQLNGEIGSVIAICPVCGKAFQICNKRHLCDTPACRARFRKGYFPEGLPSYDECEIQMPIPGGYGDACVQRVTSAGRWEVFPR